jgi:hypothetical protein
MGSLYVLVSAAPGKARELFDQLGKVPGVVQRQHLFGEQIAVRLDEARMAEAHALAGWAGVREARVYHDHDAWVVGRAGS